MYIQRTSMTDVLLTYFTKSCSQLERLDKQKLLESQSYLHSLLLCYKVYWFAPPPPFYPLAFPLHPKYCSQSHEIKKGRTAKRETPAPLREDTHKKSVFLVVGPLRG